MSKETIKATEASVTATINNLPVGTVMPYMGLAENMAGLRAQGWLPCDGTSYKHTDFPLLYNAIKTSSGGTTSEFNVPDLRGVFLRGVDREENSRDPDRDLRKEQKPGGNTGNNVGTLQGHQFAKHRHTTNAWGTSKDVLANRGEYFTPPHMPHDFLSSEEGGNETRPINISTHYIIFAGLPA